MFYKCNEALKELDSELRARLQEGGNESTETNKAASGGLDVGSSSASRLGGCTRAGGRARAGSTSGATGTATRCGGAAASWGGTGRGGSAEDDSGAVVCADDDGLGAVDVGGRAGEEKGVDASADSGDGVHRGLRGDSRGKSWLVGGNGWLGGNASDNTERVGLSQLGGLWEGVDGRRLSRRDGESSSRGEEGGGTHFGWCCLFGVLKLKWMAC